MYCYPVLSSNPVNIRHMQNSAFPDTANRPAERKFQLKPLLVMVLCTALFCIFSALALIVQYRQHALDEAIQANLRTTRLFSLYVSHLLETSTRFLDDVSGIVRRDGWQRLTNPEGLAFLKKQIKGYPEIQAILLVDGSGKLLLSTNSPFPLREQVSYIDREYFIQHREGKNLVFGEQLVGRTSGRRMTPISLAVRSPDGKLQGIVIITIDSAIFSKLSIDSDYTENKEITLLREDGAIFTRFPEHLEPGQRFPQSEVLTRIAHTPRGVFSARSSITGEAQIMVYEKLPETPLVVVTTQDEGRVLAAWRLFGLIIIMVLLLLLTLLGGVSYQTLHAARRMKQLQDDLEKLAHTDSLTGLYNRRYFMEQAEGELRRAQRYATLTAILMFDLDHFKRVNDTYGHSVGDQVLREVARHTAQTLRAADIVGRIGGEEFAILLPQVDAVQAREVASRLCTSVADLVIRSEQGVALPITISLGVAITQADSSVSLQKLLAQADHALYEAKHRGRNQCVTVWEMAQGQEKGIAEISRNRSG